VSFRTYPNAQHLDDPSVARLVLQSIRIKIAPTKHGVIKLSNSRTRKSLAASTAMGEYAKKSPHFFSYNVYVHRKPELDESSHHSHVENINTPIIKPLLEKYGAIAYTVVR